MQHYSWSQGSQPVPGRPGSVLTESLMFKPELRLFNANVFFSRVPSKGFTVGGKASFHFSFNLVRSWSYFLLFGVETWRLCSANDERSRVWCQHYCRGGWPHYSTGRDNRWVTSTAYLGSCRQQNYQFNIHILHITLSVHRSRVSILQFMDSLLCHGCKASFLTENQLSAAVTQEYPQTYFLLNENRPSWERRGLLTHLHVLSIEIWEEVRSSSSKASSSRRACPLV